MPGVWQRHPRYTLFVFLVICGTFYMLSPYNLDLPQQYSPVRTSTIYTDNGLPKRVERSDRIYSKVLRDRQAMIKKFGPTADDVDMFPPDKDPWPAYTVWDFFPAAYNCPHEVERIGAMGDGGKWVCGLSRVQKKADCVVYSVGINYESSFEAELLTNTDHCEVWGYDFSVKSFGPQIPSRLSHRTHFKPYALGGEDKHDDEKMPLWTLSSLMKANGHTHIDILKIDIEGWEFDTLTTLIKPYVDAGLPLPFGQLQLEIHAWNKKFPEFLKWWEMLEDAGLRPFMTEPNLVYQNYNRHGSADLAEYSFINVKGQNIFMHDPPSES
ncbi:putative methyltransferase-like protein 24 [Pleurotus pulmonarius]|nr:hypothetical protein EYR36_010492 [Pleurotus pulmonarius]KAF4590422.1 hypothetical protein EYR38_009722 [Pleurotus pulmonarius]